jgi:hypothetical protein
MNLSSSLSPAAHTVSAHNTPLICFSHLRWDFVLQRPQHLMNRFAKDRKVFFFEEFIPTDHHLAYLEIHSFDGTAVKAVRPRVPHGWRNHTSSECKTTKLAVSRRKAREDHPAVFSTPVPGRLHSIHAEPGDERP